MIRVILIVYYILFIGVANGQIKPDVIKTVSSYSKRIHTPESLAKRINNDFKSDTDKAAAIYVWIAHHIAYDVKTYYSKSLKPQSYSYSNLEEKAQKEKEIRIKLANTTIKKKQAVCEGYSTLYQRVCELCDLQSVIISGSGKTTLSDIGKWPKKKGHAWNAVWLNNSWHLLDVTWGAGAIDPTSKTFNKQFSPDWFMLPPERFAANHFPKDKQWLLTSINEDTFARQPLYHNGYLFSGLILKTPSNGIIKKVKNGNVHFIISSAEKFNQIYFAFQNMKTAETIEFTHDGDEISFKLPVGNRRSGYFTVFADGKAWFSFKLDL